ncbi:MAG: GTPase, partial [Chloroflexi bacterium]|nr:GTPase [Chloroflexota bacterium]
MEKKEVAMAEAARRTARGDGGDAVRRTIVIGAAGRDFHNFLVALRDDPAVEVVAFTAAQIPHIEERCFPAALAGPRYPHGIPIVPESRLEETMRKTRAHEAIFSYSDVSHEQVMHVASRVLATGADFRILGPESTLLESRIPVISICAVRTGSG